ncbi:TIGR04283 family arsenosugar biosynthesis glycosyltransferase [Halanaerobium hydrogeniformans]|uniref:4,4'-diaponeurosporenoate glycosyltransferase n=1 Tax=Halanaerobium hydrogeniformans TaxID=656519 RepID=E4RJP9_HALHG|nr:TIGR04283 family arsenosugar biosynthesis glycosyltransferase [Halanaerobium hydrogeniformans]ADQ15469.1 glycosyl transferase family 2 [Halanaerobium hydrogeniformans]
MDYSLSVIIPVLNEEYNIVRIIDYIEKENVKAEIIVSDGDSEDLTVEKAKAKGAKVVVGNAGRGQQLNRGAQLATAPLLLFLHADSRLEKSALESLVKNMTKKEDKIGGCFKLKIESEHPLLKFISWSSNLRAKYLNLIFGDQGIFIRKKAFQEIGGFPEIELMEDWEFSKKMAAYGDLEFLEDKIYTSARRWEKNGVLKTFFLMHKIKILYILGVKPRKLKKIYKDSR